MKVSKGQSQPYIAAAAVLILRMVLGLRQFYSRVLTMTHVSLIGSGNRLLLTRLPDATAHPAGHGAQKARIEGFFGGARLALETAFGQRRRGHKLFLVSGPKPNQKDMCISFKSFQTPYDS